MLPGEILESTHSTDSDGDLSLKVEYAFYTSESKKRLTKIERAQRNDLNYVGSSSGAMATTPSDASPDEMLPGDLATARQFGQRIAEVATKLRS